MFLFRCICGNFLVKISYSLMLNVKPSKGEVLVCLVLKKFCYISTENHDTFLISQISPTCIHIMNALIKYKAIKIIPDTENYT